MGLLDDKDFVRVYAALAALGTPAQVMPHVVVLLAAELRGDDDRLTRLIAQLRGLHEQMKRGELECF